MLPTFEALGSLFRGERAPGKVTSPVSKGKPLTCAFALPWVLSHLSSPGCSSIFSNIVF